MKEDTGLIQSQQTHDSEAGSSKAGGKDGEGQNQTAWKQPASLHDAREARKKKTLFGIIALVALTCIAVALYFIFRKTSTNPKPDHVDVQVLGATALIAAFQRSPDFTRWQVAKSGDSFSAMHWNSTLYGGDITAPLHKLVAEGDPKPMPNALGQKLMTQKQNMALKHGYFHVENQQVSQLDKSVFIDAQFQAYNMSAADYNTLLAYNRTDPNTTTQRPPKQSLGDDKTPWDIIKPYINSFARIIQFTALSKNQDGSYDPTDYDMNMITYYRDGEFKAGEPMGYGRYMQGSNARAGFFNGTNYLYGKGFIYKNGDQVVSTGLYDGTSDTPKEEKDIDDFKTNELPKNGTISLEM